MTVGFCKPCEVVRNQVRTMPHEMPDWFGRPRDSGVCMHAGLRKRGRWGTGGERI